MAMFRLKAFGVSALCCALTLISTHSLARQDGRDGVEASVVSGSDEAVQPENITQTVESIQTELNELIRRDAELRQKVEDLQAKFEALLAQKSKLDKKDGKERPVEPNRVRSNNLVSKDRNASDQPSLRYGGFIFVASPAGSRVIAYNPETHEERSIQLNATQEEPLKVTPVGNSDIVGLALVGSKITRIAAFDVRAGKWYPVDLSEPVKGRVGPAHVSQGRIAYNVGHRCYTFSINTGKWDHLDKRKISESFEH